MFLHTIIGKGSEKKNSKLKKLETSKNLEDTKMWGGWYKKCEYRINEKKKSLTFTFLIPSSYFLYTTNFLIF